MKCCVYSLFFKMAQRRILSSIYETYTGSLSTPMTSSKFLKIIKVKNILFTSSFYLFSSFLIVLFCFVLFCSVVLFFFLSFLTSTSYSSYSFFPYFHFFLFFSSLTLLLTLLFPSTASFYLKGF